MKKVMNMDSCDDAIREVVAQQPKRLFGKSEIIDQVNRKYPGRWKTSTITTQIYACCANKPKARTQFPSSPKFLFGDGRSYQLYDAKIHGSLKSDYVNETIQEIGGDEEGVISASITLERDLEEYLVRNLGQLEEGLKLYSKESITGRQFNTDAGKIDILALARADYFVVLELKAGVATSAALGQVLAYMNWIRHNIGQGKEVRGIIIADDFDTKLKYAVSETPSVTLKKYEVSFAFTNVPNNEPVKRLEVS